MARQGEGVTVAGELVTQPLHVQYGDLLLGPGTPYRWREIEGWEELPALDSGTVLRAGGHGAFPGQLLAQPRTVTLTGLVVRAPVDTLGQVISDLNAATAVVVDEIPLVVQLDGRGPLMVWARVTRRAVPVGKGYRLGTIVGGAVEFTASDPRRYSVDEQSAQTGLPRPEPGLDWTTAPGGLDWTTAPGGLDWGAAGVIGSMTANNTGDAPTHPVVEFRGPATMPSLLQQETGAVLEYDLTLAAADVLTIDTAAGTVLLNGSASRLYTATKASVPEGSFVLPPGSTSLVFRSGDPTPDPAALAVVRWRNAHW
jgi:hypothetical protein